MSAELLEVLAMLSKEKENITEIVNSVLSIVDEITPEVKKRIESLQKFTVECKVNVINQYKNAGFSQEEAIMLAMNDHDNIKKALESMKKDK